MKKITSLLFLLMFYVCIYAQKYHDAALFNAPYGSVRYIDYEAGRINFMQDGRIDKDNSTFLSLYKTYKIQYDEQRYPISLTTDFEETRIEYDENRRISKKTIIGSQNYVITYQYNDFSVSVTQTSIINGQPQKEEKKYDVVSFDDWGNWTTKGCMGTKRYSTHVTYERVIGSVYDRPIYNTESYTEGKEKEDRIIAYWSDYVFQASSSPNEIFIEEVTNPFFLNYINKYNRVTPKEVEQYFKKNNIEYKKGRGNYGTHTIEIENWDKLFYGFPIMNVKGEYRKKDYFTNYSIDVVLQSKEQRADFIIFLIEKINEMGFEIESKDIRGITFNRNSTRWITFRPSIVQKDGKDYYCVRFSKY